MEGFKIERRYNLLLIDRFNKNSIVHQSKILVHLYTHAENSPVNEKSFHLVKFI